MDLGPDKKFKKKKNNLQICVSLLLSIQSLMVAKGLSLLFLVFCTGF